jgi:hypothetical protein
MHNYHSAFGSFPAVANFDKDGKPLLSWRVHLLPFLDEQKLYQEFHLNEPWDSEHNKALIKRMPAVYRSPNIKWNLEGKTTYLAPVGKALMFTGDAHGVTIKEITDGLAITILLVDGSDDQAVLWTKPEDLKIDPKDPMRGLLGHYRGGFYTVFADASVHFIPEKFDKAMLYALFTRNGGELISLP